jgi:hypothetical protein
LYYLIPYALLTASYFDIYKENVKTPFKRPEKRRKAEMKYILEKSGLNAAFIQCRRNCVTGSLVKTQINIWFKKIWGIMDQHSNY